MTIKATRIVEIAFTTAPMATPTWSTIPTADVRSIDITRGRTREQDVVQAGTATVTLNNRARRYDPSYTGAGAPYNGNILPMRRIRIRATYNAVTYTLFSGFIDNWDQQYTNPRDAVAVLSCTDGFEVLQAALLPNSPYVGEVQTDNPILWWRLGDSAGSLTTVETITGVTAQKFGAPTLGVPSLIDQDANTALSQSDLVSGFSGYGTFIPVGTLPTLTFEAVIKTTTGGFVVSVGTYGAQTLVQLQVPTAYGRPNFGMFTTTGGSGTSYAVLGSIACADGNPHHIAGTWDAAGTLEVFVDGVSAGTDTATSGVMPATQELCLGNQASNGAAGGHDSGLVGTIDEVAIYTHVLSAARILAHAGAALAPWAGDRTGARINRVLDLIGWPTADRNIDTGVSTLQAATTNESALSHLQNADAVEQGLLFMTSDGKVRFRSRPNGLNLASQATFGDTAGELPYSDLTFEYSNSLIKNVIRRQNAGGVLVEVTDATSITNYGRRVEQTTGLFGNSDSETRDAANYRLYTYKDPLLRVASMVVAAERNPATLYPQVLGREIGEQITVNRRPQAVGSAISQASRIEGISHTITPGEWTTTYQLSPADTGVYWLAGVTGSSEAGVTTRAGF